MLAQQAYEHALSQVHETQYRLSTMSRLGVLYLRAENYSAAKDTFLRSTLPASCATRLTSLQGMRRAPVVSYVARGGRGVLPAG